MAGRDNTLFLKVTHTHHNSRPPNYFVTLVLLVEQINVNTCHIIWPSAHSSNTLCERLFSGMKVKATVIFINYIVYELIKINWSNSKKWFWSILHRQNDVQNIISLRCLLGREKLVEIWPAEFLRHMM